MSTVDTQPVPADPVAYPVYEPGESCYAIVTFQFLGSYRADCRIIEALGNDEYSCWVLVPMMMQDMQKTTRHAHNLAKLDDPDKWPRK